MLTGQFGYGSCRHHGPFSSVQGWKITETVRTAAGAELPDEVFQRAAARCGEYTAPIPPEFATPAQLRELPASMRLDRVDDSVGCLLKVAYAGPDYSRRDSIFGHGLLVSGVLEDELGAVRPAELWDWNWLHPIGPEEIEDAALDPATTMPKRNRLIPASLRPFAFDHPEILRPLLAALSEVLRRPRMLILIEPDPAVAACWFAALQYFLPPAAAWSIPFDTYRRPVDLPRSRDRLSLIAVTDGNASQLGMLREAGVPVISTLDPPSEVSINGRPGWHGVTAEPLVADSWAMLACSLQAVNGWDQSRVFEQLDQISAELSAGGTTSPLWALPAALMSVPSALDKDAAAACAELLIECWPTEESLAEAASGVLREKATAALRDPYRTFRQRAVQLTESTEAPSNLADLVVTGYLANSLTANPSADETWWLPPANAVSPAAYQQLLDALPGLLRWTGELAGPDLRAARAVALAGLIVDGATEHHRVNEAWNSLKPAMYRHLLPILAADSDAATGFVATAPPRLARTLWENGVERFLSTLCERKDATIPAEFEEYLTLIERFRSAMPGERLAPSIHEWLADWLDAQLIRPADQPERLTLEQAAFRVTSPRDGLDLEQGRIWAYLARLEYRPSSSDSAHWPLKAARLTWGSDLRGMSAVAARLIRLMPPEACTAELLEALLLATPLGEADLIVQRWPGMEVVLRPLFTTHMNYPERRTFIEPAPFYEIDEWVAHLIGVLDHVHRMDPDGSSAFAESARRLLATYIFSLDLCSAIETLQSRDDLASVQLKQILTTADYDAAWQELCRPEQRRTGRREKLMAMLHVRSVLGFQGDPALDWLTLPWVEQGKRPLPALAARLRAQLQHSVQYQQEVFAKEVFMRARRVVESHHCQGEISRSAFGTGKEFLRACAQGAARLLPAADTDTRSGMPFSR
ncbi:MAG: hypothetical protein ACJ74U_07520 [Jatrophihabitantaceae bacterium]